MADFLFEMATEIRNALALQLQEAHLERSRAIELGARIRETIAHSRELMERADIAPHKGGDAPPCRSLRAGAVPDIATIAT
jgi:hypothetical protein